jgi:SAM-dependent methyltransferase
MLKTITQCRACQNKDLLLVLSLGNLPLANALLTKEQLEIEELKFPLNLVFCSNCALVQITETVSPDVMFSDYLYFSSFSDTMVEHARLLVNRLIAERSLGKNNLVIEVASNDGYLLKFYKQMGIPVLGIEPAANIAAVAEKEHEIPTRVEFFDCAAAEKLANEGKLADIIHANNVFAHVPDPNQFVAGLKIVLKPDGVAVIEAPYLIDFIEKVEFDTIYHEHFSYYSLTAVNNLIERHGLVVTNVERINIHGGSLRYFISYPGNKVSASVKALLDNEENLGVKSYAFYKAFAQKVHELRDKLLSLLIGLKQDGKTIAAYGASAKGSTLLNAFGIGENILDFVVDRSTVKQGYYTTGSHLHILSPDALLQYQPDYVLLLTWNFKQEILEQQASYRKAGGKFIVPIPILEVC